MAKQWGGGDQFYLDSTDLSGTTQSLGAIGGGHALLDVTPINVSAVERIGGQRDGRMEFVSFFDPAIAHPKLNDLPTVDAQATYLRGATLGNPAASMVAKQIDYNPTREAEGAITFATSCQANGYGLTWGVNLTAGLRHDVGATNGTAVDTGVSADFGWVAFLHVTSFTGTDVTIALEDSADNINFLPLLGGAFTAVTAVTKQRLASATTTATVRQYVRAITTTAAGFTHAYFVINFCKHSSVVTW